MENRDNGGGGVGGKLKQHSGVLLPEGDSSSLHKSVYTALSTRASAVH